MEHQGALTDKLSCVLPVICMNSEIWKILTQLAVSPFMERIRCVKLSRPTQMSEFSIGNVMKIFLLFSKTKDSEVNGSTCELRNYMTSNVSRDIQYVRIIRNTQRIMSFTR